MRRSFVSLTIIAFWAGLMASFVWKMVYHPEPLFWVIVESIFITALAVVAIVFNKG